MTVLTAILAFFLALGVGAPTAREAQLPGGTPGKLGTLSDLEGMTEARATVFLGTPAANRASGGRDSVAMTTAIRPRRTAPGPNVRPASQLHGLASWYGTGGPGMYAAMHDFVDGTNVQVAVCAFPNGRASCITVPVTTQCGACRWQSGAVLVDLSVPAFRALDVPLSAGLVRVTVQVLR